MCNMPSPYRSRYNNHLLKLRMANRNEQEDHVVFLCYAVVLIELQPVREWMKMNVKKRRIWFITPQLSNILLHMREDIVRDERLRDSIHWWVREWFPFLFNNNNDDDDGEREERSVVIDGDGMHWEEMEWFNIDTPMWRWNDEERWEERKEV